jgi:hypothetical protein
MPKPSAIQKFPQRMNQDQSMCLSAALNSSTGGENDGRFFSAVD